MLHTIQLLPSDCSAIAAAEYTKNVDRVPLPIKFRIFCRIPNSQFHFHCHCQPNKATDNIQIPTMSPSRIYNSFAFATSILKFNLALLYIYSQKQLTRGQSIIHSTLKRGNKTVTVRPALFRTI